MYYELLLGGILAITAFSVFIAVPFYIFILIIIRVHRNIEPFNSEFFVIFFALGVVDIICYLVFLFKKAFFFDLVPWFFQPYNEQNTLLAIFFYPFWIFGFLQYQLIFILSINRFVSIVFPNFYNKHWTIKRTHNIIFGCFIFSAILCIPAMFTNCQINEYTVVLDGINRTLHNGPIIMPTSRFRTYFNTLWMSHVYGLLISSIILYGIMLVTLRNKLLFHNRRNNVEMQLFYIGFMIFLLNLVFTTYFFMRDHDLAGNSNNPHFHEWVLFFISDLYDMPNSLMVYLTSALLREIVRIKMRRIFNINQINVTTEELTGTREL